MSPRLTKELRPLAIWPAAAALFLFAVMPWLEDPTDSTRWPRYVFGLYLVVSVFVPSARLFGAELDQRTMAQLLSQPIARGRIWREKMGALAVATLAAFMTLQLARHVFEGPGSAALDLEVCLVALSGGPLFSLLTRQSLLGLGAAICTPMTLIWISAYLLYLIRGDFDAGFTWLHAPAMMVYVPVAYTAGRRQWMSFELDHRSSGRVRVPQWLKARPGAALGPNARLVLKELQLLSGNLLILPTSLVAFAAAYGLALTVEPGSGLLGGSVVFLSVLVSFLLVCLFPLLLGASSVAAERQLGVAEWQLGLPISRARQWALKLSVIMGLALIGGAVPAAVLGRWLFALMQRQGFDPLPMLPLLACVSIPILAAAAGMYASSRAREPFRAVLGAVALFVVMLVPSTFPQAHDLRAARLIHGMNPQLAREPYLAVALASAALLLFAFTHFRPEPWDWSNSAGRAARSLLLGALLLTIGYWFTSSVPI